MNANSRLGVGVLRDESVAGSYSINAGVEVTLEAVLTSVYTASTGRGRRIPFEIRLVAEAAGIQFRSKTAVVGFPIAPVTTGNHTSINLDNAVNPASFILANTSGGVLVLYVLCLE